MTEKIVTQCLNDGCQNNVHCKGLCVNCYNRMRWKVAGKKRLRYPNIPCHIEGCGKPSAIKKRALCAGHYQRVQRHGSPYVTKIDVGTGRTRELRFWSKVLLTSNPERCWLWQGKTDGKMGYGKTRVVVDNYTIIGAHRVAYYFFNRKVPTLSVLHSCDNPICVNPHHLREGTAKDNVQDAITRGRWPIGQQKVNSRLQDSDIPVIRQKRKEGVVLRVLAEQYNVNISTISLIVRNKSYRHIL